MHCRRHGTKPTVALWMLVAVADVALLVASAGLLLVIVSLATLATAAGVVLLLRQRVTGSHPAASPVLVRAATRRRA